MHLNFSSNQHPFPYINFVRNWILCSSVTGCIFAMVGQCLMPDCYFQCSYKWKHWIFCQGCWGLHVRITCILCYVYSVQLRECCLCVMTEPCFRFFWAVKLVALASHSQYRISTVELAVLCKLVHVMVNVLGKEPNWLYQEVWEVCIPTRGITRMTCYFSSHWAHFCRYTCFALIAAAARWPRREGQEEAWV